MDKKLGSISWFETDNGFRIEAEGDSFKKLAECGCLPMMAGALAKGCCCCNCNCDGSEDKSSCCSEEKDKSEQ